MSFAKFAPALALACASAMAEPIYDFTSWDDVKSHNLSEIEFFVTYFYDPRDPNHAELN